MSIPGKTPDPFFLDDRRWKGFNQLDVRTVEGWTLRNLVLAETDVNLLVRGVDPLDSVRRGGLIPRGAERKFAKDWALRLQLKYGKLTNPAWTLSGGNQQKAVLAKWLARKPSVLIVDEPTRGIDVATKAEVHRLLSELAAQGVAVLMISSELPEVLGMADRIVVLFEGRVTREFARAEASEDAIMRAATGTVEEAA